MEKGNKKKSELQNALKMLAIEKGYANVTMKDIGEYVGLSVGGLYHHYHDVEEIFNDLISKRHLPVAAHGYLSVSAYTDDRRAMKCVILNHFVSTPYLLCADVRPYNCLAGGPA